MNRSAIKRFATWAATELRQQMRAKAERYGVSEKGAKEPQYVAGGMTVAGFTYDAETTALYRQLRDDLNDRQRSGETLKDAVVALVDEMAYTWFNRLTALRFMEVQGYIGRVLSASTPGMVDPDALTNATSLVSSGEYEGVSLADLDRWRRQGDEEAYRRLLVAECRKLASPLPFLFGNGKPYAAIFLPEHLLAQDSVIRRLERDIPEADWADVEIIGWLYQFYISDRKDEVFAKKGTYEPRDIPAATQLFTPHWIVRYMLENSLGRLWLEHHPESALREHMPYYLESQNSPQPPLQRGEPVRAGGLRPHDLSVLDPACGSGHILVYAFDLLFLIYLEAGYPERDIPRLILEHNLYGLDIDERAAQLASFALMMRAREKSRRVLRDPPALNVRHALPTRGWTLPDAPELKKADWQPLLDAFRDADSLGSLIAPPDFDAEKLRGQLDALESSGSLYAQDAGPLRHLLAQAELLGRRYRVVVANPPYMGSGAFGKALKDFVSARYPRSKSDLFAVFMEKCLELTAPKGVMSMINQHAWMFLSSYEKLREHLLDNYDLQTMLHLGPRAFPEVSGEVVQSTAFTIANKPPNADPATFVRLVDYGGTERKERAYLSGEHQYTRSNQNDFEKIPGSPIAYWVSEKVLEAFVRGKSVGEVSNLRKGLSTGQNDQFCRQWIEVSILDTGFGCNSTSVAQETRLKWFPLNKGGEFRRWYGNQDWVVNWQNDGLEIRRFGTEEGGRPRSRAQNTAVYFKESSSWSKVTSGSFVLRYFPRGFIPADAGSSVYSDSHNTLLVVTGLLNSRLSGPLMADLAPTLNFEINQVANMPLPHRWRALEADATKLAASCIAISKTDWDNFETSWDFQTHPFLRFGTPRLTDAFRTWSQQAEDAFYELKRLEEENNRYWIDAYGLQDELTPEVPDEQVTIRKADLGRDVRSLISYAVGCMMGRYSLATPGLQFAGGAFERSAFAGEFLPDPDGVLPITDEAYFEDDIVSRFVDFLRVACGKDALNENLEFVAGALVKRANETALERIRRYFLTEFVPDHNRTYSKRPIYWLFTSGKERAFGALVYLHRYTPDTLAALRNDYVLDLQTKLSSEVRQVEAAQAAALSASQSKALGRRLEALRAQQQELLSFQDRLQHAADQRTALDLDDGVAYNYTLFGGLVYEGPELKMADLQKRSEWKRELLAEAEG